MIQPNYFTLSRLFVDRVFRIPAYQRFYSWQTQQREDLFNDINAISQKPDDSHHFMATIVCHDTGEVTSVGTTDYHVFEVVDGQQRITSLVILLRAVAKMIAVPEEKKEVEELLVKRDGNLLLLQTNNANQALFNDYLRAGTVPAANQVLTHADHNLREGIRESESFVATWLKMGNLMSLLKVVKNRLGFVVYDTEDKNSVYTVFEVLNSRGLEVDWLDKCKSMLMGRAYETAPTAPAKTAGIEALESTWGNIYQRLAMFPIEGHEVLRITASTRCNTDAGKPLSAEASLAEFRALSTSPEKTQDVTRWIYRTADALVNLEQQPHLGPVTNVLQARVLAVALILAEQITEDERVRCLDQWERVTFRIYGLLRHDSRTKVGDYVRLARRILRQEQDAKTGTEILTGLKNLGTDFPADMAVEQGIARQNCYHGFEAECRYMLWRYEEYSAFQDGAEVNKELRATIWQARSAAETIEHIFPQTPEVGGPWEGKLDIGEPIEKHVHRIGNLLLLPFALNNEAKRKGFAEKKLSYAKSEGLRIVRDVMREDDWTQAKIEQREARIITWAKTAWADLT